ncbi:MULTISPECIES: hypothetical protein [unclassified Microbacterium]|uniref:hypothetical protein n=1 Tax=unclassified Microbacterium TaxID=2609290 RepID=UPI00301734A9
MRTTAPVAVLLVTLVLAGCSSTTGAVSPATQAPTAAATPTETQPAPQPTEEPSTVSLESVASTAGIADFARSTSAAPAAIAWGQGTLDGSVVKIYEFADDAGYTAFVASVAGFGITEDQLLHVGNFAVAPNDAAQLEQLRAALVGAAG